MARGVDFNSAVPIGSAAQGPAQKLSASDECFKIVVGFKDGCREFYCEEGQFGIASTGSLVIRKGYTRKQLEPEVFRLQVISQLFIAAVSGDVYYYLVKQPSWWKDRAKAVLED